MNIKVRLRVSCDETPSILSVLFNGAIVYQDYTVLVTCTGMAHWRNDTGKVKTAVIAVKPVLVLW